MSSIDGQIFSVAHRVSCSVCKWGCLVKLLQVKYQLMQMSCGWLKSSAMSLIFICFRHFSPKVGALGRPPTGSAAAHPPLLLSFSSAPRLFPRRSRLFSSPLSSAPPSSPLIRRLCVCVFSSFTHLFHCNFFSSKRPPKSLHSAAILFVYFSLEFHRPKILIQFQITKTLNWRII